MRHNVGYRKLGRTSSHRRALLRSLATSLFRHERIRTTVPKAKELRPFAEKLITLARRDDLHSRRLVLRHVQDKEVVKKLFGKLAPRFASRPGGYTRTLRLGPRQGDGADLAIVELIGSEPVFTKRKEERKARQGRKDAAAKVREEEMAAQEAKAAAAEPESANSKDKAGSDTNDPKDKSDKGKKKS
jgi:large subunit ribosomal protein L17